MKLNLNMVLEDWREDVCIKCGLECNPHYRFCYSDDNNLIDTEVILCKDCCSKVDRGWRKKLK